MNNILANVQTAKELLEAIRQDAFDNGNMSIRGVARMAGVDDKAIINGADFKSEKLSQKLTTKGFKSADLSSNGFPPEAVILTLEYFAYESKAKAIAAKAIMRTFGTIGLMSTLQQLGVSQEETITEIHQKPERTLPKRDAISDIIREYIPQTRNLLSYV